MKDPNANRKLPKVISPVDPCSGWTAKANKRVQFGYGLNYLIDIENAVIVTAKSSERAHHVRFAPKATVPRRGLQKKQGGFEPPCWVGQVSQTLNHTVSLCARFHRRARS
jgi:hypothetical protein